ncbi:GNAT family N-acetyltransferase [Umezawaea tangerina]|uniref:Putative GNAT superfamily acetyltransferase n=1 Tax=Umezawaea tangerina TaxID=84725 RepID=A0A2T0SZ81_9PSEU|nr:GNAT family N-acetyltransferase [Umezawaea tangerina]PRY38732.1 putative GNAT superfamily acetyltransferase [Umezawaea tangerina]
MTGVRAVATMVGVNDQERAEAAARAAATAAGVEVRDVTDLDDLDAVYRLYDGIWRPDPTNPPVTTKLLRALSKVGNPVTGAFDGPVLVGACVGFFGAPGDRVLHSHVAGVSSAALGRHVGFALKLHQRAWAMARGVRMVEWTYDPLVARNAHFNITKLGAVPVEYLANFYGGMDDGINGGDDSDRLLVHWDLAAEPVGRAGAGPRPAADAEAERARGAVVALGRSPLGLPIPGTTDGTTLLVAVPRDVEALRSTDPGLAKEWRGAVRAVLGPALAGGARITGFDRTGWYVLTNGKGNS